MSDGENAKLPLPGCIANDFTDATDLAGVLLIGMPQSSPPDIGPVGEALLEALDADFTIACPSFPANRRTVYRGYLFVGDVLLNESGMEKHPLTPLTDANLVRVPGTQTHRKVDYA